MALADQYAGHGKAHGLGLINPAIYTIAARHERGRRRHSLGQQHPDVRPGRQAVHRPGFSARGGYDLVTGVGTVDAAYFVPELARLAG